MAQRAEALTPETEPQPDLRLAYSFTDESYFAQTPETSTGKVPYEALLKIGRLHGARGLIMAALQAVGLAESQTALATYHEQLEQIREKSDVSASDELLLEHIEKHIRLHELIDAHINVAATCYEETFWDDFSKRTGQNSDLLGQLYDETEQFEDTPFLDTLIRVKKLANGEPLQTLNTVYDAERIGRIMLTATT